MTRKASTGDSVAGPAPVGTSPRRIVGIDPGLNITGYGVLSIASHPPSLVEAGVVRGGAPGELAQRLVNLYRGISEVLEAVQPECVAIEELYSHYDRPRTAILMGHARGVIYLAAAERGLTICSYSATQVKKILTGSGRSPKIQMQRAVARELKLSEPPEPPDVADALAIALCHAYLARPLPTMILNGHKSGQQPMRNLP